MPLLSLLFFKEQLLQESELLTFWGKPPYQPFSKQQEEESKLYKIPSLKTGLKMFSVLIFHYTDSFSCCNILAIGSSHQLIVIILSTIFYEVEF